MNEQKIQTITTPEGEELVVVPRAEYDRLARAAALVEVEADASAKRAAVLSGEAETVPLDIAERLALGGEHPLKVWRAYRGLSQTELAARSGVRQATISDIERGRSNGAAATLRDLAKALGLTVGDLMPAAA